MTNPAALQITTDAAPSVCNINYRQLDCLEVSSCPSLMSSLGRKPEECAGLIAIVLTHDCSIAGDTPEILKKEPSLEIILAREIGKLEPSYTGRQNPRRLHLSALCGEAPKFLELLITERFFIGKGVFHDVPPAANWKISDENKDIVRRWLAARYQAPSYPSVYEERLRRTPGAKEKSAQDKLKALLSNDVWISADGLFVIVEPRDVELEEGQPYELRLLIITKDDLDPELLKKMKDLRAEIITILSNTEGIALIGQSAAITDEQKAELIPIKTRYEVSLGEYNQYDLMLFDYLSDKKIAPDMQRPVTK